MTERNAIQKLYGLSQEFPEADIRYLLSSGWDVEAWARYACPDGCPRLVPVGAPPPDPAARLIGHSIWFTMGLVPNSKKSKEIAAACNYYRKD